MFSFNLIKIIDLILYFLQSILEAFEVLLPLLSLSHEQVDSAFEPHCQPDRELRDDSELIPAEWVQLVEVISEQTPDAVLQGVLQGVPQPFMHSPERPFDWRLLDLAFGAQHTSHCLAPTNEAKDVPLQPLVEQHKWSELFSHRALLVEIWLATFW